MMVFSFPRIFALFYFVWTVTRGSGEEVLCPLKRTCILPCSFPAGDEVVIHWIQVSEGNTQVHSFYYGKDQLGLQAALFKGRTSLSPEQISNGNASLQLRNVVVKDEGRYHCYTSTLKGNKDTYIQLKVYAPIEKVTIEKLENNIICSSDEVYPKPTLTWNVSSLPNPQQQQTITRTESQLYTIRSSILSAKAGLDYSCTISNGISQRKATLFKLAQKNSSEAEITIECNPLGVSVNYLIWKFNHSQVILTWNKDTPTFEATDLWKNHVKDCSKRGSLTLKALTPDQQGTYTCESRNTEETQLFSTALYLTEAEGRSKTVWIVVGVTAGVILLLVIVIVYKKREKWLQCTKNTPEATTKEIKPLTGEAH